jgi:hypothetical protein
MKLRIVAALACSSALVRADFTYQQTTQMTGGALYEMLKSLGPFARQAREPQVSTVIIKGNRMATVRKDQTTVIDLDKETITEIDHAKKQYSVVTFQQMKQAMEAALQRAQQQKGKAASGAPQANADVNFKVSAKATGQTKAINGINSREVVMEFVTEATDKSTGTSGALNMTLDNWLGDVPGYNEVKDFQKRLGEKMGYLFQSGMLQQAMMRPETLKGFEAAGREMAKVQGAPVQSVIRMTSSGDNADAATQSQNARQQAQQQQTQQQQAQQQQTQRQQPQSATDAAVGAALGRLGIGGFGRNRNRNKQAPEEPAQSSSPAAGGDSAAAPAGLIEMTTELTSFSSTADASKFDVPSGFKQVESEMVRRAR